MTANFLFDKLIKNSGYAVGAMVGGNIANAGLLRAGSALGRLAGAGAVAAESSQAFKLFTPLLRNTARAFSAGKNIEAAGILEKELSSIADIAQRSSKLAQLSKSTNPQIAQIARSVNSFAEFNDTARRYAIAGYSSAGEASFEALQTSNEYRNQLIEKYKSENFGSVVGGLFDKTGKKIDALEQQSNQNVSDIIYSKAGVGLQNQYQSYMEDGGYVSNDWTPQVIATFGEHKLKDLLQPPHDADMLRAGGHLRSYTPPSAEAMYTGREQFAMGGDLKVYRGEAETMSYNPYLPEGGETIMFRGPSHDNGGMPIEYGSSPVEVEGGEPAVKLQDGTSGDSSLVVYGNLINPKTGKKFKRDAEEISKNEAKQNKKIDKASTGLDNLSVNSSFDKLGLDTYNAIITGANMKLKQYAEDKMDLAALQSAINDTAEEYGLIADDLAKGKVKPDTSKDATAKYGTSLPKAQDGIVAKKFAATKAETEAALRALYPGKKVEVRYGSEDRPIAGCAKKGIVNLQQTVENLRLANLTELQEAYKNQYGQDYENAPPEKIADLQKLEDDINTSRRMSTSYDLQRQTLTKKYGITPLAQKLDDVQSTPEYQNANSLQKFQAIGETLLKNPGDIPSYIGNIGLESLPNSLAMMASAVLARYMTGSPSAAATAGGASSSFMEFGNQYVNARDQGKTHQDAMTESAVKSGVIGYFDAVSFGSAGKALEAIVKDFQKGAIKATAKEVGKETGKQAGYGAAGEAVGSVITGQEVDPRAVVEEALGEIAGAPMEAVTTYKSTKAAADAIPKPPPVSERIEPYVRLLGHSY